MSQDTEEARRRPGRPRRPSPTADLEAWLESLSPTALHILEAARDLLVTEGFSGLTLERVALEAGVDRSTLRHHFVTKAVLLNALFDRLQIDAYHALVDHIVGLPTPVDRLRAYVNGLGALIADPEATRAMFELAPHGLRDPVLREKFAAFYASARSDTLIVTGLRDEPAGLDAERRRRLDALAALIVAAIDGLSYQTALEPAVDSDLAFGMLADMIALLLERDEAAGA